MRSLLFAAAVIAAPAALSAKPAPKSPAKPATKAASKPTAKAEAKPGAKAPAKPAAPKPAPKLTAFSSVDFDLAPGETYLTELFVASPTGKAVEGSLTYEPAEGLKVTPDARWTGKVPPWGVKTFPKITAAPTAQGDLSVKAALDKGGEATLNVRVVEPEVEPVPGLRQLTVRIKNPFRQRLLIGRVRASNPDRFLQKVTALEFKIPAGETGEVVFPLPGAAPAESETYQFTLSFESYHGWRFQKTYELSFPPHT